MFRMSKRVKRKRKAIGVCTVRVDLQRRLLAGHIKIVRVVRHSFFFLYAFFLGGLIMINNVASGGDDDCGSGRRRSKLMDKWKNGCSSLKRICSV